MSATFDTSTITYNYTIARALFDNPTINRTISKEVDKLLLAQIDLSLAKVSSNTTLMEIDKLQIIKKVFFKDVINEHGQVGEPLIKIEGKYRLVKTINELKTVYIPRLNFREKMTMAKNFASKTNDCKMYSILLEYNLSKNIGQEAILTFTKKYPMLNTKYLDESIKLVEEILGFGISETSKCYSDMNGKELITTPGCAPLYKMVQKEYMENPTESPITLCWLWHPLVYGVHYQDVIKLPSKNLVKKLSTSYTGNKKELIPDCMSATFSRFPIFPPLSQREQNYIKKNMSSNSFLVDGLYQRPPWTPPICYMKPLEPTSFSVNLQERYKKYFVSNLSGHVMLFLIMSKYFNNINLNYIILANILYMVPYNHSIHEIFQAAKMMGINTEYSIEKTDLENINNFLRENQLNQIILPTQAEWIKKSPDGKTLLGGKGKTRKHTNRKLRKTRSKNHRGGVDDMLSNNTAFLDASYEGNQNKVLQLLEKGANIDTIDHNGATALMYACSLGHIDIAKLLINRGAKVNITDNDGYTALMAATGKGYENIVVFLVDNGADINIMNHYDKTAIDLANDLEHYIIKHYLEKKKNKRFLTTITLNKKIPDDMEKEITSYFGGKRRAKTRKQKGCGPGFSRPKPKPTIKGQPILPPKPKTVIFYENPVSHEYEDEPRIHPDEFYCFDKKSIDRTLFPNRSKHVLKVQHMKKIRGKATGQYYARQPSEQLEIDIKEMRKNYKKGGKKNKKK